MPRKFFFGPLLICERKELLLTFTPRPEYRQTVCFDKVPGGYSAEISFGLPQIRRIARGEQVDSAKDRRREIYRLAPLSLHLS